MTSIDPCALLDRFYDAFWSDVSWQLRLDLPENASMALGRRIAEFLEVPETVPLNYGYKLATSTNLLNQLPD